MITPTRERVTARVLLFDPDNRILLLKGRLPSAPDAPGWWFTVGGGVEPGESLEAAAKREIIEETGFSNFELGDFLFRADDVFADRKGRAVRHIAMFHFARCAGGEPAKGGWDALEQEFVDDIRWWTLDDLEACPDRMFPPDLVARARAALAKHG